MKIKKYLANDYLTAINRAKKEMGRDAIILNSRQINRKGILGLFGKKQVEITVAIDDELRLETDHVRRFVPVKPGNPSIKESIAESLPHMSSSEMQVLEEMNKMQELMVDIKNKMYEIEMIKGFHAHVQEFYNLLLNNNVDKSIALKIASSVENRLPGEKCNDSNWVHEVCIHTLQEYINEVQPIVIEPNRRAHVVVLVGPTGVGKTTTIAKLAANFTFVESHQSAFITLDTYRISATEQLRTFAEIIGIPLKVVFSPSDLEGAIQSFMDRDIIFIDTAGRSPYNNEQMEELQQFIDVAKPDETILVLSVNTESNDLIKIYERFSAIGVNKIIFTKLDETNCYGQLLNVFYEIKTPLAYFTTGQSVPDDIEVPLAQNIARMLLGKEKAYERSS